MLFGTCWFYIENYQSNKKFTEGTVTLSCFSLSLTHFGPMFSGFRLCFEAHIKTSQFILHIELSGWFFCELQNCGGRWILVERWLKLG